LFLRAVKFAAMKLKVIGVRRIAVGRIVNPARCLIDQFDFVAREVFEIGEVRNFLAGKVAYLKLLPQCSFGLPNKSLAVVKESHQRGSLFCQVACVSETTTRVLPLLTSAAMTSSLFWRRDMRENSNSSPLGENRTLNKYCVGSPSTLTLRFCRVSRS